MYRNDFDYTLIVSTDETPRGFDPVSIKPDFVPAYEAVRFEALRRGEISGGNPDDDTAVVIEPIFAPRVGEDRIRGIRAVLRRGDSNDAAVVRSLEFPLEYFGPIAREAAAELLERGSLRRGEAYYYGVLARPATVNAPEKSGLLIEQCEPPLTLSPRNLRGLLGRALLIGDMTEDDPPLFVDRDVLLSAIRLAREGGANEVGAILAGHVCQDPAVPEIFVEITAMIPMPCPQPELTRFRFTPQAWEVGRAALRRRGNGEEMVGWLHSHRFAYESCAECRTRATGSRAAMKACSASLPFLSPEDCYLHRLVFARAYSVALLVNDAPCTGVSVSAFGWRGARIARRAYHVLGEPLGSDVKPQCDAACVMEGQT